MEYNDSFFEKKYYAPTDVISGYQVRPGYYLRNGASVVEGGLQCIRMVQHPVICVFFTEWRKNRMQ